MTRRTTHRLAAPLAVVAMMLAPSAASASTATLSGTVVQDNARTHTFVIADQSGRLSEVHAKHAPNVGRRVQVSAKRLRNGTWSAARVRQGKMSRGARVRGTVTYSAARSGTFVVSARGVSLLVRRPTLRRAHVASAAAAAAVPAVGEDVTVSTDLAGGEVTAASVSTQGVAANGIDLEGVILSMDPTAGTISISADDAEQSSGSITVTVPPALSITQFSVGETVELIVSLNPDGTYTLEQSSADGNVQQADNSGDQQGNTNADQQPSAAQLCTAQSADPNFPAAHNGETFSQYYAVNPNEPNSAFGDCVDALSADGGSQTNPQQLCLAQRSDPNFAAAHNGETFLQFYSTNPTAPDPGDAFGNCVDVMHQQAQSQSSSSGNSSDS